MPTSYIDPSGILYLGGGFVEPTNNPQPFPVDADFSEVDQISLSWDAQSDALFYRVWMGLSESCMPLVQDRVLDTSAVVPNLTGDAQYFFQVTAVYGPRQSAASEIGFGVVASSPPEPFCFIKLVENNDYTGFDLLALAETAFFSYFDAFTLDWATTTTSCGLNVTYSEGSPPATGHDILITLDNVPFSASDDVRGVVINIPDAGTSAGVFKYQAGSNSGTIAQIVSGVSKFRFQPNGNGDVTVAQI